LMTTMGMNMITNESQKTLWLWTDPI